MMKPSKARRIADELGIFHLAVKYPNEPNPYPEDDRRHEMFKRHRMNDCHLEDLYNVLGGRPPCTRTDCQTAQARIKELESHLEISSNHDYDGIYTRDETIRFLEKRIERLRHQLSETTSFLEDSITYGVVETDARSVIMASLKLIKS